MSTEVPKPTLENWAFLLTLAVIWGASFMAVTIALRGFEPLSIASIRILIAAACLCIVAYARSDGLPSPSTRIGRRIWLHCAGMAVFSNALPFSLLSWAQLQVPSGYAGITMAIVPLMVLPLAFLLIPGERLGRAKVAGFLIGFAGVIVLIGPGNILTGGGDTLARFACIAAASSYAVGAIITRLCPTVSPFSFSAASILIAGSILTPIALAVEGVPSTPPADAVAAVIYLGLGPTALATMFLVRIIQTAGPSFLSLVNYQVPVWSLIFGVVFLAETLPPQFIGALALIFVGLALSQMSHGQRRRGPSPT